MKSTFFIFILISPFFLFAKKEKNKPTAKEKMEFSELSYPFETKFQQLDSFNINLAYVDEGKGDKTIVFIHGLGSYLPAWKLNIDSLKQYYRCIAIDLPGYGKSSKGQYPYSLEFYSNIIIHFLNKLNIQKVTLCGHSMGGQISMLTALKYSDRVENLILCAPAGFESFNKGEKRWFRQNITTEGVMLTPKKTIITNLYDNFYNMPKSAQFMIDDRLALRKAKDFEAYCYAVTKSVEAMVNEPVINYLKDIKQPALIIFGANDQLIPNRYMHGGATKKIAEYGQKNIPNSTLKLIPKCGHFVQYEKAKEVNTYIHDFLK